MYLDAISKLNDMQEERLDQLTLNYMLNPKRNEKTNSQGITLQDSFRTDCTPKFDLTFFSFQKVILMRKVKIFCTKLKTKFRGQFILCGEILGKIRGGERSTGLSISLKVKTSRFLDCLQIILFFIDSVQQALYHFSSSQGFSDICF